MDSGVDNGMLDVTEMTSGVELAVIESGVLAIQFSKLMEKIPKIPLAVGSRCQIKIRTHTYLRGKYAVQEIKSYGRV